MYKKIICAVCLLCLCAIFTACDTGTPARPAEVPTSEIIEERELCAPFPWTVPGAGLEVLSVENYNGHFIEDGSDAMAADLLAITVKNTTEKALSFAQITVFAGDGLAYFELSSLPAGATALVLEKNGMLCRKELSYSLKNISSGFFEDDDFSLHSDTFELSTADRSITLKNISGSDITGVIHVQFKMKTDSGVYFGGRTFRADFDGLRAGESKTVQTAHFTAPNAEVMFITYNE